MQMPVAFQSRQQNRQQRPQAFAANPVGRFPQDDQRGPHWHAGGADFVVRERLLGDAQLIGDGLLAESYFFAQGLALQRWGRFTTMRSVKAIVATLLTGFVLCLKAQSPSIFTREFYFRIGDWVEARIALFIYRTTLEG